MRNSRVIDYNRNRRYRKRRSLTARLLYKFSGLFLVLAFAGISQLYHSQSFSAFIDKKLPIVTRHPVGKTIEGRASVIDGDTIRINGRKIRLHGIDAPEARQTCTGSKGHLIHCGSESTRYLRRTLRSGGKIVCKFVNWDRYGRFVGDCYSQDGRSLAAGIVSAGYAVDWPKYSGWAYSSFQRNAKAKKLGMWAYRFEMPWEFRARQRSG